jgi:C-terminal processing protease CtpA/Prc
MVTSPPQPLLDRILRAARTPGFRTLVVDVRSNGGGDNTTYWPLLELIEARPLRGHVVVLLGRMTFSAAANFAAAVDHQTRARLVGEPSGGAPNQWGDRTPIRLPVLGLTAYVAAEWVEVEPSDERLAVEPDVLVESTVADFLAGRDSVLRRALALR